MTSLNLRTRNHFSTITKNSNTNIFNSFTHSHTQTLPFTPRKPFQNPNHCAKFFTQTQIPQIQSLHYHNQTPIRTITPPARSEVSSGTVQQQKKLLGHDSVRKNTINERRKMLNRFRRLMDRWARDFAAEKKKLAIAGKWNEKIYEETKSDLILKLLQ